MRIPSQYSFKENGEMHIHSPFPFGRRKASHTPGERWSSLSPLERRETFISPLPSFLKRMENHRSPRLPTLQRRIISFLCRELGSVTIPIPFKDNEEVRIPCPFPFNENGEMHIHHSPLPFGKKEEASYIFKRAGIGCHPHAFYRTGAGGHPHPL